MPNLIGWLVGFLSLATLMPLVAPATCADGWLSPSIGRRGACSRHGGVQRSVFGVLLVFSGSIALGMGAGALTASSQQRYQQWRATRRSPTPVWRHPALPPEISPTSRHISA